MSDYFAEFKVKYNNPKKTPDYMLPTPEYLASVYYDDDYRRFYQLANLLLEPKYQHDFEKQKEYLELQKKLLSFFNIRPHVHNIDEHVRNQVSPIKNCYVPQKKQKKQKLKKPSIYLDDSDIDDLDDPDSVLDVYNYDGERSTFLYEKLEAKSYQNKPEKTTEVKKKNNKTSGVSRQPGWSVYDD